MKTYGKYKDSLYDERELDAFHMHEILDRVHLIRGTFEEFVEEHPAAILFKEEIDKVAESLDELYNKIGRVYL